MTPEAEADGVTPSALPGMAGKIDKATITNGGRGRGFSRIMPAFGDELTSEQIDAAIAYLRGQCRDRSYPRGELNLPRPLRTEKVLVVDDNADALTMLADALEQRGFPVFRAHNAPSALPLAEKVHPQIALLDIGLPVMDGYELGRRLREISGLERMRAAYRHAIASDYRFYSYGDACLLYPG